MTTKTQAVGLVAHAVKTGKLTRPTQCETCGKKPEGHRHQSIIAHHWQGYNNPLDVLWVCHSCNRLLVGKHDGSLTREQAKVYIRERQRANVGRRLNWFR